MIAGSSVGSPEPYDGSDFLIRVYPNPTQHQFTAMISIPDSRGRVRVQMFDAAAREAASLLDRFATESVRQNIQFDTRDLSAGTYFVRVAGASGSAVAPLTIVR